MESKVSEKSIPISTTKSPQSSDDSAERAHHPYSPSQLQSLEACPCYLSKESTHIRTIIGTISHKVTETGIDDARLSDDDAAAVAECMDFYEKRRQLAHEVRNKAVTARAVELAKIDNVDTRLDDWGKDMIPKADKEIPPLVELTETYLPVDDCVFDDTVKNPQTGETSKLRVVATTAGYVDRVVIAHSREYAELFDWKFGYWGVEKAENNLQAISYSIGLFKMYPQLDGVRFWFKQPNTYGLSQAYFTRQQIPALYLRIQTVVHRAREARRRGDFSMANPMVPNCNFCAHLGHCEKVLEVMCKVGHKFHPLEIPADITPSKVMDPLNTKLALMLAQVAATWAPAFRTRVTDRVLRREAALPEGFAIATNSRREIVDMTKMKDVALRYISPEEYEKTLSTTFGAIEELINKNAPRGQKKHTVEKFQLELVESGAAKKGEEYSFLRAVPAKEKDSEAGTKTNN